MTLSTRPITIHNTVNIQQDHCPRFFFLGGGCSGHWALKLTGPFVISNLVCVMMKKIIFYFIGLQETKIRYCYKKVLKTFKKEYDIQILDENLKTLYSQNTFKEPMRQALPNSCHHTNNLSKMVRDIVPSWLKEMSRWAQS